MNFHFIISTDLQQNNNSFSSIYRACAIMSRTASCPLTHFERFAFLLPLLIPVLKSRSLSSLYSVYTLNRFLSTWPTRVKFSNPLSS